MNNRSKKKAKSVKEKASGDSGSSSFAWSLLGAKTLVAGAVFWTFVASQVVITGPAAIAIFGTLASSSAVGIGSVVGYCAKRAKEAS